LQADKLSDDSWKPIDM